MKRWTFYGLSFALLATAACVEDATQVVLVVSSDLEAPDEIDRVIVEGTLPDGQAFDSEAMLVGDDARELPRVLTLLRRNGPLGPISLRVVGRRGDADVVERRAQVSFLPGHTRMLPLDLLRDCRGVECPSGETCSERGCRRVEVQAIELVPWPGHERIDRVPTVCDGVDFATDPNHCGGCGRTCSADAPGVESASCRNGSCALVCAPGFYDCDGRPENGCESNLRDVDACGACDHSCELPNAVASCADGECMAVGCRDGYADCDGDPTNGCESNLRELDNCGACGARCEMPNGQASCETGVCRVTECGGDFADCDGRRDTGCETDLRSTWEHCGSCGRACPTDVPNTRTGCEGGRCVLRCLPGWADCDREPGNGCEAYLGSPESCGSCGQTCEGFFPLCAGSPDDGYHCTFFCAGERCGSQCVDTNSDPNHCGGCDQRCRAPAGRTPYCDDGRCRHR